MVPDYHQMYIRMAGRVADAIDQLSAAKEEHELAAQKLAGSIALLREAQREGERAAMEDNLPPVRLDR